MVDVTHDGDDRRAADLLEVGLVFFGLQLDLFFEGDLHYVHPDLFRQLGGGLDVEYVVDGGHDAALEQRLDQVLGLDAQLLGELAHGHAGRDGHRAFGLVVLEHQTLDGLCILLALCATLAALGHRLAVSFAGTRRLRRVGRQSDDASAILVALLRRRLGTRRQLLLPLGGLLQLFFRLLLGGLGSCLFFGLLGGDALALGFCLLAGRLGRGGRLGGLLGGGLGLGLGGLGACLGLGRLVGSGLFGGLLRGFRLLGGRLGLGGGLLGLALDFQLANLGLDAVDHGPALGTQRSRRTAGSARRGGSLLGLFAVVAQDDLTRRRHALALENRLDDVAIDRRIVSTFEADSDRAQLEHEVLLRQVEPVG